MSRELIQTSPRMFARLRNLPLHLRQRGVACTLDFYRDRLYESWRDSRLGISTKGYITASQLGFGQAQADCQEYEPVSYRCLNRIMAHLQPGPDDIFLDYGCGKGRAMVHAAQWPLRMVVGVELSAALAAEARRNIELASGHLLCRNLHVHEGDAAEYEVPRGTTIVFLFNSFKGRILDAVLTRIAQARGNGGRALRIVYLYPGPETSRLDHCPWLRRAAVLPLPSSQRHLNLVVYEAIPLTGPGTTALRCEKTYGG